MTVAGGKTVIVPKEGYGSRINVISDTLPAGFVEGAKLVCNAFGGMGSAFVATVTKKTNDRTYLSCEFVHDDWTVAEVYENEAGGLSLQGMGTLEVLLYNYQKEAEIVPPQTVTASGDSPASGPIANYNYDAVDGEYVILVINGKEIPGLIISQGNTWLLSSAEARVSLDASSGTFMSLEAGTYTIAAYTVSMPAQWSAAEPAEPEVGDNTFVITDSGNFSNPSYSANYDRIAAAFDEDNNTRFIFQVNRSNMVGANDWVYTTPVMVKPDLNSVTFYYVTAITHPDSTHAQVCLREVIFSPNTSTPVTTNYYFNSSQ